MKCENCFYNDVCEYSIEFSLMDKKFREEIKRKVTAENYELNKFSHVNDFIISSIGLACDRFMPDQMLSNDKTDISEELQKQAYS